MIEFAIIKRPSEVPTNQSAEDRLETMMLPLREEIKKILKRDFLLLEYNLEVEEGIRELDSQLLIDYIVDCNKNPNLTVILHGGGGDFVTALLMACTLRKLNSFVTYVPQLCCSAMNCLFLKSDKLILTSGSQITQIDPVCQYAGRWLRAIQHLHSPDSALKGHARTIFSMAEDQIINLIREKPSLFKSKEVDFDAFGHTAEFVSTFMNKETHSDKVSFEEMQELDLNVEMSTDTNLFNKVSELIKLGQDFLKEHDKRVILVSSAEIEKSEAGHTIRGHFIIPNQ